MQIWENTYWQANQQPNGRAIHSRDKMIDTSSDKIVIYGLGGIDWMLGFVIMMKLDLRENQSLFK